MITNETSAAMKLPDIQQAVLDASTVEQLFADIRACAQVIEVLAKFGSRQHVREEPLTLDDAQRLLLEKSVRGVQLRYRYDGDLWWDTLMRVEEGFRLTRLRPGQ